MLELNEQMGEQLGEQQYVEQRRVHHGVLHGQERELEQHGHLQDVHQYHQHTDGEHGVLEQRGVLEQHGGNQIQHDGPENAEVQHGGSQSASHGVGFHVVRAEHEVRDLSHLHGGSYGDHRGDPLAPSSKPSYRQKCKHWMGRK